MKRAKAERDFFQDMDDPKQLKDHARDCARRYFAAKDPGFPIDAALEEDESLVNLVLMGRVCAPPSGGQDRSMLRLFAALGPGDHGSAVVAMYRECARMEIPKFFATGVLILFHERSRLCQTQTLA